MAGILGATPDASRLDSPTPLLAGAVSSKACSNSIHSFPPADADGRAPGNRSGNDLPSSPLRYSDCSHEESNCKAKRIRPSAGKSPRKRAMPRICPQPSAFSCPQFAEQIVAKDVEEAPASRPPPAATVSLSLDDVEFEKDPRMMMPASDGQAAPVCMGPVTSTSQTVAFWPVECEDIPEACTSYDFEGSKHEQLRFSSEEPSIYSAVVCESTPNSIIKLSCKYAQDDFGTRERES
ncbi:hypothetical protein Nepgr_011637 [Nepenthes gracilis]|uniref:Uncharacterized protein n=1 Tax=Nepenthes gracilis TaxID=150966 RepID=A0AAD3XMJ8_NEPGR|nr:hypothetical protein Nepgr_011637 [Nepenthes gracilis]